MIILDSTQNSTGNTGGLFNNQNQNTGQQQNPSAQQNPTGQQAQQNPQVQQNQQPNINIFNSNNQQGGQNASQPQGNQPVPPKSTV